MNKYRVGLIVVLLQTMTVVWADDTADLDGFKGKIQLGGALNYGNTESRNISTKFILKHVVVDWKNSLNLSYYFSQDGQETTASKFNIDLNTKYKLTDQNYLFISGEATFDKFAAYDRVYREAAGYGHNLYKNSVANWSLYAGPGVTHSRIAGTRDYLNQFVGKVGSNFCYKFIDNILYTQDIIGYLGKRNTNLQFKNGLEAQISKRLALDISVYLDYNTDIPKKSKNKKSLDTVTKFSIIYTFA